MENNQYFYPKSLKDIHWDGYYETWCGTRAPDPGGWKHESMSSILGSFSGLSYTDGENHINNFLKSMIEKGHIRSRKVSKEFLENKGWNVVDMGEEGIFFSYENYVRGIIKSDDTLSVSWGRLKFTPGNGWIHEHHDTTTCPDINKFKNFSPLYCDHGWYANYDFKSISDGE